MKMLRESWHNSDGCVTGSKMRQGTRPRTLGHHARVGSAPRSFVRPVNWSSSPSADLETSSTALNTATFTQAGR